MKGIQFGIIGNMGPEADTMFQNIVRKEMLRRGAKKDQAHIGMIVVKNPDIPDRSEAINEGGKSPISEILASVRVLEQNKVQFAVMPCNTAHYFKDALQQKTDVLLLDMLKAVTDDISTQNSDPVVGVLATTGTCHTGIYDKYLQGAGLEYHKPNAQQQEDYVHSAIYGEKTGERSDAGQDIRNSNGIKAGEYAKNTHLLSRAIKALQEKGVNTVILGCTELPLVREALEHNFPEINFVDPMEVIAKQVVTIYNHAQEKLSQMTSNKVFKQSDVRNVKTLDDAVNYVVVKAKLQTAPRHVKVINRIHKRTIAPVMNVFRRRSGLSA